MDIASILRFLTTFVFGWLVSKWPALENVQIFGESISELILIAFAVLGGVFLPQARSIVPKWLRDLIGWKTEEEKKAEATKTDG